MAQLSASNTTDPRLGNSENPQGSTPQTLGAATESQALQKATATPFDNSGQARITQVGSQTFQPFDPSKATASSTSVPVVSEANNIPFVIGGGLLVVLLCVVLALYMKKQAEKSLLKQS